LKYLKKKVIFSRRIGAPRRFMRKADLITRWITRRREGEKERWCNQEEERKIIRE